VQEVIVRTNAERTKRGLLPLKSNAALTRAAEWLAKDMAERGYFDHTDRQGRDIDKRLPDFGYAEYRAMGENIAAGQRSAEEVVAGWMKSPGHRANILEPKFREIGVGITTGRGNFGARKEAYPVVINGEEAQTRERTIQIAIHGEGWAEEMRYRVDGARWTAWQTFTPELTYTLSGKYGEHRVEVELRRGERVLSALDTIELLPETEGVRRR
jgi:Cysteine-rich secretory protein family